MINRYYTHLAIFVILWMTAYTRTAAVKLPALTVPNGFGVNIHFRGQPRDLDLIANAGFKFIRMDLTWEAVEREKGVYDFEQSGYDDLTKGCSKRGIRILYILDYSNRLYESDRSVRTEQGRRAYAAFAEAAASRYSGNAILWEIWNESNIKQFWRPEPNVDDYCKLVEATTDRIRKADNSGLVVAPATSTIPFKWLEDCFKRGLLKWIDVLSVHPYRPRPPETVIKDYARLRELMKSYTPDGKIIPIISGEWGYSNINWDNTRLSNEQQAQYLVREFLINLYQKVPVSIWYDWKNDGTNPNEREHHFGTVMHDLKPKPAYIAANILSSTLNGFSIDKRLDLRSDEDFAFILTKEKTEATAVWTTGKEHKVTLPIDAVQIRIVHFLGNEEKRTSSIRKNGGLELTISQNPQYLLITNQYSRRLW